MVCHLSSSLQIQVTNKMDLLKFRTQMARCPNPIYTVLVIILSIVTPYLLTILVLKFEKVHSTTS